VAWCGQQNVIVFSFTQRQFWKEHFIETNQLWSNSWLKEGQSWFLETVERNLCVHTHNSKFQMKIYSGWFFLSMIFNTQVRNWYLKPNNFSYNSTNKSNVFPASWACKRGRKRSSLTLNGGPGYEPGCQFHAPSCDSVFLFLPDSATVFPPLSEFLPKVYRSVSTFG